MWKKAHILGLIIIYRQIIWFWEGLARLVRLEYLTDTAGQIIILFTQFRPDFFFYFLWSKGQNFFSNFGWPDYLFYLQKLPDPPPPRNQLVVPKTNQEINEPSYEMVGVKKTVTNYVVFLAFFFLLIFYFLLWQLQMFSS